MEAKPNPGGEAMVSGERGRATRMSLAASISAAVAASLCCLGPALLIAAGGIVTASMGSVFGWFKAWRPLFTAVSIGFLGVGYWYVFRSGPTATSEACETGACTPRNPVNKTLLGTLTLIVLALITSPYWLEYLL